jgi:hypothetical protein
MQTKTISSGNYVLYEDGRVFSNISNKFIRFDSLTARYHTVSLWENKKVTVILLHRLLAKTFIPNPNNYPCINHKDGNKKNNNINNLEWCTHQQNTIHSYATGLQKCSGIKRVPKTNRIFRKGEEGMVTITQKLHEKIKEKKHTYQTISYLIGISPASFSQRKVGTVPWTLTEVFQIMDILEIPTSEIADYFKTGVKL